MRKVNGRNGKAGDLASAREHVDQKCRHATESARSRVGALGTIRKKRVATTQNVVGTILIYNLAT